VLGASYKIVFNSAGTKYAGVGLRVATDNTDLTSVDLRQSKNV